MKSSRQVASFVAFAGTVSMLAACGGSVPPDSASAPAASAASLYSGPSPRPGPDQLYAPAADAPQLQNTGVWQAPPILVSGASAYRRGEFLYQDYLYDDHGANGLVPDPSDPRTGIPANTLGGNTFSRPAGTYTYPTDAVYANNAADLVEFRVRPLNDATAFRITLNTLNDAERSAFTLAIGDAGSVSRAMPHGANTHAPANFFVTVHGARAELRRADTGDVLAAPTVTVDAVRRQIELRIPHASWDPGQGIARFTLGVGLWDAVNDAYLAPTLAASATRPGGSGRLPTPSAFFNAAFRYAEPRPDATQPIVIATQPAWWRDSQQASVLAAADLAPLHADVDFGKLASNLDDDMKAAPGGVPQSGALDRILASHYETQAGAQYAQVCGVAEGCLGELRGQLQPYAIYVPATPAPAGGYGLTLLLHSLAANYNQYLGSRNQSQLGDRGRGYIVITPEGRGPDGWYVEYAGADTFEVWADVARHYPLSPDHTTVTGYSMGGYGTFRFATRYPDLFAKAQTTVGPPAIGTWLPPLPPSGGEASNTFNQLAGLRNIPILMWVMVTDELVPFAGAEMQARGVDALGYRYEFRAHAPGEHLTLAVNDSYAEVADFLGDATVDRNPPHVSYVVNPKMDFADVGLVGDHAYWLSAMHLRDGSGATPRGSVEAISHGFGLGDPAASGTQLGAGVLTGGTIPAIAYNRQSQTWGEAPATAVENRLTLTLRNISSLTVNPQRAKLGCDVALEVDTDGPVTVTLADCNRSENFGAP